MRRCAYSIFIIFIKYLVYLATKQQIIAISENVITIDIDLDIFQASKEILVIINNSLVHFYFFLFFFFFEGGGGPKGLVLFQSWVLFDLSYLQPGERLFKVDF